MKNNPSLGITVCHYSASLVMPKGIPQDGFFYPTLTFMMDSYITYLKNSGSESTLLFTNWHDGTQRLETSDYCKRLFAQLRRKHVLKQLNSIFPNIDYRLVQKGKPEDVPRRQYHCVNIFFNCPIFELYGSFFKLSYIGLDLHAACYQFVRQLITDCDMR